VGRSDVHAVIAVVDGNWITDAMPVKMPFKDHADADLEFGWSPARREKPGEVHWQRWFGSPVAWAVRCFTFATPRSSCQ
jgi:hypothetical protein